jgi:hypothetical protein
MTAGKSLAIIALLVGGTSLAMAQYGPQVRTGQTGPKQPYVASPYMQAAPGYPYNNMYMYGYPYNMYMSASRHKRLQTGQQGPKQPQ